MRPPQLGQQVNGYNASGTAYALAGINKIILSRIKFNI